MRIPDSRPNAQRKGMPIGIPDDEWDTYLFRLIDAVNGFYVTTLGMRESSLEFRTKIFMITDEDQYSRIPLSLVYDNHGDAESCHECVVGICSLAENAEELLTLFEMAKHHVIKSEAIRVERSEDR